MSLFATKIRMNAYKRRYSDWRSSHLGFVCLISYLGFMCLTSFPTILQINCIFICRLDILSSVAAVSINMELVNHSLHKYCTTTWRQDHKLPKHILSSVHSDETAPFVKMTQPLLLSPMPWLLQQNARFWPVSDVG
jgi:hypothetical protein